MKAADRGKHAISVLGPVPGTELGTTLPHEHVTIDNSFGVLPRPDIDVNENLSIESIGSVRAWPRSRRSNLILDADDLIVEELRAFHTLGGRTIVEMTTAGNGRDLERLRNVSLTTGVNIIATTGCYVEQAHSKPVLQSSVDELTEMFIADLTSADVRCGAIGEIGLSREPTIHEWKGLEAAMQASAATGAPVWVHITTLQPLGALLAWFQRGGHPTDRTVICHMDHDLRDLRQHYEALEAGFGVEFDLFGFPAWSGGPFVHSPNDTSRLKTIVELSNAGFASQLFMSHDVCQKIQLRAYGGFGFTHILENVQPLMGLFGGTADLFDQIAIKNPRRLLTWADE